MRWQKQGPPPGLGRLWVCILVIAGAAGCNGNSGSAASSSARSAISISGTPETEVAPGQAYSFTPIVTPASDVTFSVQNKPSWADFSISTGQLTGIPTSANVGTYSNVVISVTDGAATATLPSFSIIVSTGGTATLTWQAPTATISGSPLTDLAGYVINYGQTANTLTQSVDIASASTTKYVINNLSHGAWYFAVV